jgi:hypothetical protein
VVLHASSTGAQQVMSFCAAELLRKRVRSMSRSYRERGSISNFLAMNFATQHDLYK